ncbi:MAG: hypothetical protein IPN58_03160 [Anaerolineales bacterium]|nr:hypothetical protein [Anaerolineales bacterium]
MANKPASRNWNDIQLVIATGSMAFSLIFWNMFAGPDREAAIKRAQEQAAQPPMDPVQIVTPVVETQPTAQGAALPSGPILLGGTAPQTQIIVQTGGGGGGGGNNSGANTGANTGGGTVTSTGSS